MENQTFTTKETLKDQELKDLVHYSLLERFLRWRKNVKYRERTIKEWFASGLKSPPKN